MMNVIQPPTFKNLQVELTGDLYRHFGSQYLMNPSRFVVCMKNVTSQASVTENHSVHEQTRICHLATSHIIQRLQLCWDPNIESFHDWDRRNQEAWRIFRIKKAKKNFPSVSFKSIKNFRKSHPWITHKRGFFLSITLWILTKRRCSTGHASWNFPSYPHVSWVNAKGNSLHVEQKKTSKSPLHRFKKKQKNSCGFWGSSWWLNQTPLKNMLVKLHHLPQGSGWKKNI